MDFQPEPSKRLMIEEVKCQDPVLASSCAYLIKSSLESSVVSLKEVKEVSGDSVEIQVLSGSETYGSAVINLSEDSDVWVQVSESFSLKVVVQSFFTSLGPIPKPHIHGLTRPPPSPCEYIRRLQEIEEQEREISALLAQSRVKAPTAYKEYLDSSPRSSNKRSPLKRKTLDTENFPDFDPDFKFRSFFDVTLENISSLEAALLEHASVGMLSKLRSLKFDVEEYELTDEIIQEFDSPMKNLKESVEESKGQFEIEEDKKRKLLKSVDESVKDAERQAKQVDDKNAGLIKEIERVQEEIKSQAEANEKAKGEEKLNESQVLRAELAKVLEEIQSLEHEYGQLTQDFNRNYPEQELAIAVNEKLLRLSELHSITATRDSSLQETLQLQAELLQLEAELNNQEDREYQIAKLKQEQSAYSTSSKHISLQLKEIQGETDENLANSEKNLEKLKNSTVPLLESIKASEAILAEKSSAHAKISENLTSNVKNNSQLELILEKENQIIEEYSDLQQEYKNYSIIQHSELNELENLSNSLLKVSSNSIISKRLLRRAEDMVEEQELQHVSMCKLIALIKETKPAYIAVQNDPVDMALAKFLNSRHKTLDVNFKRSEKEKYVFGSLKLEIKLEDGLFVLINGQKLNIEEFLEAYSPAEKEKNIKRSGSKPLDKKEEKKEQKIPAKLGKSPLIPLAAILKKVK